MRNEELQALLSRVLQEAKPDEALMFLLDASVHAAMLTGVGLSQFVAIAQTRASAHIWPEDMLLVAMLFGPIPLTPGKVPTKQTDPEQPGHDEKANDIIKQLGDIVPKDL